MPFFGPDKTAKEKLKKTSTQCILNKNLKKFADKYNQRNEPLKHYANIVGDAVKVRTALTTKKSQQSFLALKTPHLSAMVPYTKLYKETSPGDLTEFKFDAFHDPASMTSDVWGRGSGSGIKSISIDMDGDNHATSSRQFKVSIKLFFSSVEELFRERSSEDKKYSYIDLVTPVSNFNPMADPCANAGSNSLLHKNPSIRYLLRFGYTAPSGQSLDLSEEDKLAVQTAQRSIYLNLYKHTVDFAEDGTVQMTAEFHGQTDRKFINIDVLQLGLSGTERNENSYALRRLEHGLCRMKNSQKKLSSPSKKPVPPCEAPPPEETESEKESRTESAENLEEEIEDREEALSELRTKGYSSFITKLVESGRVYNIPYNNIDPVNGTIKGVVSLKRSRGPGLLGKSPNRDYFFFGDLLDDSFGLAKEFISDKKFNFILGSLNYRQPGASQAYDIPIAAIPISMTLFREWFKEHVIKKGERVTYNFMDFIKDVLNNLVKNTFVKRCYDTNTSTPPAMPKFAVDTFTSVDDLNGRVLNLKDLHNEREKFNPINNDDPYTNYYIYGVSSSMEKAPRTNGTEEADAEVGIYHLISGREFGLVKNIKFTKTDQKFVNEARMASSGLNRAGPLRAVYNAEVSMFGNPLFRPGMMVYLASSSFSARDAITIGLGGYYYVSKVYNNIEDGKFKTELKCTFHHSSAAASGGC